LDRFEGRSTVSSWIHGIARHVYLDWRRADRPGEFRSDEWWNCEVTGGPGPDASVEQSDLRGALYAAVDRLEEDVRETIHLHHYQGLTLQETADALGVATSTVKYRLRQGIAELKRNLAERSTAAVKKRGDEFKR
jgi:RNA polymerase sigma-70 factor (ECF subfamily)